MNTNLKILETERLILRPWRESDAEAIYKYAQNPNVGPMAGWKPHQSIDESRHVLKTILNNSYAVVLKELNEPIGSIELMIGENSYIKIPDNEGEIGYWIGEEFWGHGLIPEATKKLMHHAFTELKMQKIWCGYFVKNIKSRRVQEKCGFRYRFTERDRYVAPVDEYRDENMSRITINEWLSLTDNGKNHMDYQRHTLCDARTEEKRLILAKLDGILTLSKNGMSISRDFSESLNRIKNKNIGEENIVKAAKIRGKDKLKILDATAGLGEDAFLLAAAGHDVDMYESDPVIVSLLVDGMERVLKFGVAREDGFEQSSTYEHNEKNTKSTNEIQDILSRMTVHIDDSIEAMNKIAINVQEVTDKNAGGNAEMRDSRDLTVDRDVSTFTPDVIILDPMFPERNKSALVKKKFQLIHELEDPCDREVELLNAALNLKPDKIIIKRPIKATYLAGKTPTYSIKGSTIRWDCISL